MKSSAVYASALLSAVSVSAVQSGERELECRDVACEVAQFLDVRSLIDFSKSSLLFSQAGRKAIGIRMNQNRELWTGPYLGPMIECKSEQEWDKMAEKIGKSNKRAILTFGDRYTFFRGVPEDAKPGYTGMFIGEVKQTGAFGTHLWGPFNGQTYVSSHNGQDWVIRLLDENFEQNPEVDFGPGPLSVQWMDSKQIVRTTLDPQKLELYERNQLKANGFGDLIHSLPFQDFPNVANFHIRLSKDYDGPEVITVTKEPKIEDGKTKKDRQSYSLTYNVYRLDDKKIGEPKKTTIRLSFYSEEMIHRFSNDGRFIVTLQHNGPMLAITDTFDGRVKETLIHHRSDEDLKFFTDVNNRYCMVGIHNLSTDQTTDRFLDLKTGEIIGSAMDGVDEHYEWISEELFRFRDDSRKQYARSVQQPRDRITLEQGLTLANENCVIRGPNNEVLHGHWEKD